MGHVVSAGKIATYTRYAHIPRENTAALNSPLKAAAITEPIKTPKAASVVSQADGLLSSVFLARRTFSKMSSALATQTKPFGLAL